MSHPLARTRGRGSQRIAERPVVWTADLVLALRSQRGRGRRRHAEIDSYYDMMSDQWRCTLMAWAGEDNNRFSTYITAHANLQGTMVLLNGWVELSGGAVSIPAAALDPLWAIYLNEEGVAVPASIVALASSPSRRF